MSSFRSKSARQGCQHQAKSIKFVKSCAGHVDGLKKRIENNSLLIRINQNSSDRKCMVFADAKHLVVKVAH